MLEEEGNERRWWSISPILQPTDVCHPDLMKRDAGWSTNLIFPHVNLIKDSSREQTDVRQSSVFLHTLSGRKQLS